MGTDRHSQFAQLSADVRRNFAVIVPAFNEVDNMPDLVSEFRDLFRKYDFTGEVILVDDGSTDGTADMARKAAGQWPNFKVVSHRRNFGKTESMLTGAEATTAEYLILFDADLQHSVEEVPRYLEKLQDGFDIVTGRKIGKYEKRGISTVYNWLNKRLFKIPVSDLNSMKGFRREVLNEVHLRHDWHRFFVVLGHARGFSVTEIDIALLPRRHGESKYSGRARIVYGLLDLISVGFFLFFSKKPMVFFGMTGLALAVLGLGVGLTTIALRIVDWEPGIGFRPFLYLVILLEILGFLLFGFGFIAELVAQQNAELDNIQRRIKHDKETPGQSSRID
jgi:glycosyltransferase involved in cell wall biosynthesis